MNFFIPRNIIAFLVFITVLISCKKSEIQSINLSGTIRNGITKSPLDKINIDIYSENNPYRIFPCTDTVMRSILTDSVGNFNILFEQSCSSIFDIRTYLWPKYGIKDYFLRIDPRQVIELYYNNYYIHKSGSVTIDAYPIIKVSLKPIEVDSLILERIEIPNQLPHITILETTNTIPIIIYSYADTLKIPIFYKNNKSDTLKLFYNYFDNQDYSIEVKK